jgi:hypothetical protein
MLNDWVAQSEPHGMQRERSVLWEKVFADHRRESRRVGKRARKTSSCEVRAAEPS